MVSKTEDRESDLSHLYSYLRKHAPREALVPVGGESGKTPIVKHAFPSIWTMSEFDNFRRKMTDHTEWALLARSLCVIDVDNVAVARELETRFPILLHVARESTSKGMHYFFRRSQLADRDGYFDARAPAFSAIDFKTRTSKGTGGVVVCAPSRNKKWVAEPWLYPDGFSSIPDELLVAVARPRHPERPITFVCAGGERLHVRARHSATASYVRMFDSGELSPIDRKDGESAEVLCPNFDKEIVRQAVSAVETGRFEARLPVENVNEALRFCDFCDMPSQRVAAARMAEEERRAIARIHPEMATALSTSGLVDMASLGRPSSGRDGSSACGTRQAPDMGDCEIALTLCAPEPPFERPFVRAPGRAAEAALPECVVDWLRRFPEELVCAGGRVAGAVCNALPDGTDVDLYVLTSDAERADFILDSLRCDPAVLDGNFTGCAYTMVVEDSKTTVQLVLCLNEDLETLLRGFDFSPCRIASRWHASSDSLEVMATPDFVEAIRSTAFPVLQGSWTDTTIMRLAKYIDVKGLRAYIPDLDRNKVVCSADRSFPGRRGATTVPLRSWLSPWRTGTRSVSGVRDALRRDQGVWALLVCENFLKHTRFRHHENCRGAAFRRLARATGALRLSDYMSFSRVQGSSVAWVSEVLRGLQGFCGVPEGVMLGRSASAPSRVCARRASWRTFEPVVGVRAIHVVQQDMGRWRHDGSSLWKP